MTALALRRPTTDGPRGEVSARVLAVLAALGVVVVGRWTAWRSGALDPILLGALFGAALLWLAVAGGWRPRSWAGPGEAAGAMAIGTAGGLALIATATLGPHPSWAILLAGVFPLAPWAAATALVAAAEEALLRGALLDALADAHGIAAALVVTSAVFALMHVPVYGWSSVPLDLGVGLVLGGLRLVSGGIAAPVIAHAIADLAVLAL